jgi:hypothetical protein
MEDPSHYPGNTRKNNRRRGSAGINTASENPSAQEIKDGPKKANSGRRRFEANRDPEGEERGYTTDQRTTEIGQGSIGDHPKFHHIGTRGK